MELIKPDTNINFVGKMAIAVGISLTLIVLTVVLWFGRGPNLGIDFLGGTEVEITFTQHVTIEKVRAALGGLNLGSVEVKRVGGETGVSDSYIIRVEKKELAVTDEGGESVDVSEIVMSTLKERVASYDEKKLRVSLVGPRAGADLRRKAFVSVFVALVLMLIYIAVRFEVLFAFGAVLALAHDVLLTMGFLVASGKEFNLTTIAALLTIVGYSLNDTIVVYDRIRENERKFRGKSPLDLINTSINETLSRTLLTSGSTLTAVIVLLVITRGAIQDFSYTMTLGILVGTYSSVFVASAFIVAWRQRIAPALGLDKKKGPRD